MELSGHLDFRVVHLVLDAFSTLARGQGRVWVLDATELADWDRSGLLAISAAYRLSLRHQRRLTLAGAPPRLRQALARMRLDHHVLRPDGADPGDPPPP